MTESQKFLGDYVHSGSEAAFGELVNRYVGLVYSTALRLVEGDTHRAQDVSQMVFVDLARDARNLPSGLMLGGWLHRHTCFVAAKVMRGERRRLVRERHAAEMNALQDTPGADFTAIAPLLDEAIDQLSEADRTAILLRFFEKQDFQSVGAALGSNPDAGRMRVKRALEKLEVTLRRRGITTTATALGLVLASNAVHAAPTGLALTISSAAAAAGTSVTAVAHSLAMTTLQKTIIGATIVAAVSAGIYEGREISQLRARNQLLQQQQAPLSEQISQLTDERDQALRRLEAVLADRTQSNRPTSELLRLRAETQRLRETNRALSQAQSAVDTAEVDASGNDLKSLLERVAQLKTHLQQSPNHWIPELHLASHSDWVKAVEKKLESEEDYRQASARLRSLAKDRFAAMAAKAMTQFGKANEGKFPSDLAQLKPYFGAEMDAASLDAMLARYQILNADEVPGIGFGGDKIASEKSPVDDQYDSRSHFAMNGSHGSTGFAASSVDVLFPVAKAYAAANGGREPTEPAQLVPYVKTPAQRAALQVVTDAALAYEQANGKAPTQISDLQPYLKPGARRP